MRSVLLVVVLCLTIAASVSAQNPFTNPSRTEGPSAEEAPGDQTDAQPGAIYGSGVPRFLRLWSRSLQQGIASMSRRVRSGDWAAGFLAFGIAIAFGMVHIAGPGHGKMFAVSYFSGRNARPREGILYSTIVNAVDSISAFAIVMLGYVALRAVLPSFRTEGPRILEIVSYSLIVLFGVAHLISHLRPHNHGEQGDQEHTDLAHHDGAYDHASEGATSRPRGQASRRPPWLLALSVGLVPCPVSTILIVYGVANGVLPFMLLMVLGVSLGGFVVMTTISLAIITGRSTLLARLRDETAHRVAAILEYAASGTIILVGAVLLLGQF